MSIDMSVVIEETVVTLGTTIEGRFESVTIFKSFDGIDCQHGMA